MIIPNSRLYSIPNTKQSTAEESVCEYSKIKRLNSTVILVSAISDSDCKDYDAYKIKNINEFRLKAIKV